MNLYKKDKNKIQNVFKALKSSKHISYYDDIEVDEEWLTEFKKVARQREEVAALSNLTPEARREIQKRVVAFSLRVDTRSQYSRSPSGFIWDKVEPCTQDLMNTETVTYYGSKQDEEDLILAAKILEEQNPIHEQVWPNRPNAYDDQNVQPVYFWEYPPVRTYYGDEPAEGYTNKPKLKWYRPQLLRVNDKVAKHMASNPYCKHISEFFYTATDNNHFSVDHSIVRWYTGYTMRLENSKFMHKMKLINKEMYDNYEEIQEYVASTTGFHSIQNFLKEPQMKMFKKMIDFNAFLDTLNQDDPNAIKTKARELFVFTDATCIDTVDKDVIIAYEDLLLYLEPIALFLNQIEDIKTACDLEGFEKELNAYLGFKNRLGWKPPINLLTLNKNN